MKDLNKREEKLKRALIEAGKKVVEDARNYKQKDSPKEATGLKWKMLSISGEPLKYYPNPKK